MDWSTLTEALDGILTRPLLTAAGRTLTVQDVLAFVAVLVVTWLLARGARAAAGGFFTAESEEEAGASGVAEAVAFWSVFIVGSIVALGALGLEWLVVRTLLNEPLFTISGTGVTLSTLITAAIIVAITWGASRLFRQGAARAMRARGVQDRGTITVAKRLIHYLVMAIGLGLALDNLGVDLAALFAAGAIVAVGIGFAMQNIAQNFVSGLILLVERSIKPGDVLEVEDRVVQVEKMGIRSTVARTRDEEEIIIPNATLVQNSVKNYTLRDSLFRLRATVGVEYGSDMRRVMEALQAAADALEWRFQGKDPLVFLIEFGDSSVVFEVSVWMADPWTSPIHRSELNQAIWWALKEAGITIAFPQLDVHFDPPVEESIQRMPRAS
ncbi:MAG: mechanosensitive ion channel [Gemmatimonadetes bacterium]|nr:mechanosensitive ion channel [Gemmatimonadota bacterium]